MKKFLLILVVILASCANPVVDVEEPVIEVPEVTNPFVGTWKCSFIAPETGKREVISFTFRDDGIYTYYASIVNLNGTGNYTYNDTHFVFNNFSYTSNIGSSTFPDRSYKYTWMSDKSFHLDAYRTDSYGTGIYIKQ